MMDLAVRLHGVRKSYRYFTLDNIDLQVPHGQICAIKKISRSHISSRRRGGVVQEFLGHTTPAFGHPSSC
jgi:hypothetical protein